eukprot:TRINITY_DN17142_c0_g3_i1.p1 TRINITY_DN17142_c0_g3~~TRINITY_DN17142_c0_g3_i1.p1  ORF type:complete len:963 (-),score=145.10 TRINITY_DN17142_c0_g3_i1:263-3109(-)
MVDSSRTCCVAVDQDPVQEDGEENDIAMGACCSLFLIASGLIFVGGFVLQELGRVGSIPFSSLTALALAGLAGASFSVCGVVLVQWPLTASLGKKLVRRVTHARSNWETDALRSFCEVGIWLGVLWGTFRQSGGGAGGIVVALICSTFAGCLLAIMGDALQEHLRAFENRSRDMSASPKHAEKGVRVSEAFPNSGPMLMMALYGHGAIQIIYQHSTNIVISCLLGSLAGLGLLMASKLLQLWPPMRHAGVTLQHRITNTADNWRKFPIRSAIESTFWGGIVIGTYEFHGDALQALQVGTVTGIIICLSSELYWHHDWQGEAVEQESGEPAVAPVCIFAYAIFAMLVIIFANADHWSEAVVTGTIAGIAFTAAGQLLLQWSPTHKAGHIINCRVVRSAQNWSKYPLRSVVEVSIFLGATWAVYGESRSFVLAPGIGALTSLAAVLGNHYLGWGVSESAEQTCDEPGSKPSLGSKKIFRADSTAAIAKPVQSPSEGTSTAGDRKTAVDRKQRFTWDEVSKHTGYDDIWVVIDHKVYDLTGWAPNHPGGSIIYKFAGVDASDQFAAFHQPRVGKRLPRFLIGEIDDAEKNSELSQPSAVTLEYRALRQKLWSEGYFEPDLSYYKQVSLIFVLLILSSIALILVLPESYFWWRCLGAGLLLGIGWQQLAFLGHDAAHNAVVKSKSGGGINLLAWFLCGPLFGISSSMWNEEHSMHHAITLRPREDPQFNYLPLWLISPKELQVPGTTLDRMTRALVSIQHFTFLPLVVLIGRFNFYLISMAFALKRCFIAPSRAARMHGFLDVTGMIVFWTWYFALVRQLESTSARWLFVLASHWACGILHVQLLLSHLFTETFTAEEERKEQFFSFQLKTTRNIDVEWYEHWFHGGLEYQIEHHLFPQLPRHNLHKVKPFVLDICNRHGIPYTSTGACEALSTVMQNFRQLAWDIVRCEIA